MEKTNMAGKVGITMKWCWSKGSVLLFGLVLMLSAAKAQEPRKEQIEEAEINYTEGYEFLMDGYYQDAITSFQASLQVSPSDSAYMYLAYAYVSLSDFNKAIAALNTALDINPNYAMAYNTRGVCYLNQDKTDLAIIDYTRAIELKPHEPLFYHNRQDAYKNQGNFALAIKDCDVLVALNPTDPEAYEERAFAYFRAENYTEAMADASKVIELDPEIVQGYNLRALSNMALETNPDQAIADLTKVIELDPGNYQAYASRAAIYVVTDNYLAAIDDYTTAIGLNKDLGYKIHYFGNRGMSYIHLGDHKKGVKDLDIAVELDPSNHVSHLTRGLGYMEMKKYDIAIENFTRAIELSPEYADAYDSRAEAYQKAGHTSLAEADMEMMKQLTENQDIE